MPGIFRIPPPLGCITFDERQMPVQNWIERLYRRLPAIFPPEPYPCCTAI